MRQPMRNLTRRSLAVAVVAATALLAAACVEPAPPAPAPNVTNAVFEWTISRQADNGAFNGEVNYWSAGRSDSTQGTYVATNGNATVLKKNASGTYVPIASETAVNWTNRNRAGNGALVTSTNAAFLGQKVRLTNGTGTVNATTGKATIRWTGTFSVNFYGSLVPFWIVNPTLNVDASGVGRLTATVGGFASDQEDPDVRVALADRANVVLAEFPNFYGGGSIATGNTSAAPKYLGRSVTVPAEGVPQQALFPGFNDSFWGAWPQSFVDFQQQTGLGAYWYTSGGFADQHKPQEPVSATWTITP